MPPGVIQGRLHIVSSSQRPPLILMAHDVFQSDVPLSGVEANIAVNLEVLAKTLTVLRSRGYEFISFEAFMERRRDSGVALLTFDEAYRSVSRVAFPVLKAVGIPAVVFVVTGAVLGAADPFPIWLLMLRDKRSILEEAAAAPLRSHRLVARVMAKSGFGSLAELLSQPLAISVEAFREALTQAELDELAEAVAAWPGLGRVTMDKAEIHKLMQCGLIELGAHSVSHRSFARLSNQEVEAEVAASIAAVADLCGRPPSALPFAYPYGAVTTHAARYVGRTCRAGFTCHARPITTLDPAATLPRINLDRDAIRNSERRSRTTRILALTQEKMRLHMHPRMLRLAPVRWLRDTIGPR
ncbi:Polysaccharide deacetylase [Rhizobiales bacterium GAS113]|nr:Polysaccharide deacetylase [Rhizobiales bacterium GAS113]